MTRRRLFELLEPAATADRSSRRVDSVIIGIVLLSVLGAIVESVHAVKVAAPEVITAARWVVTSIFALEWLGRLWTAPEHASRRYHDPVWGRLRLAFTPYLIIDLLAFLPEIAGAVIGAESAELMPAIRLLRVLKLVRYSGAVESLGAVLWVERKTLLSAATIGGIVVLFMSGLMYVVERDAQPEAFANIPSALWWGIVTLTTVGYGDVSPVTPLGKFIGAAVTILGIAMFALPAGILANGFAEQIRQREFLKKWDLVANVPLFSRLTANQIAAIARVLEPRTLQRGQTLFRRGDPPSAMYFLASGELEVGLESGPVRLDEGFVGEIALLHDSPRTATVTAATRALLLELSVQDFRHVLDENPDLADEIDRVATERSTADTPDGEATNV